MKIEILVIKYGTEEYFDTITLRNEVFRKPYGLDIKDDNLEEDKNMNMYGVYLDSKLIGTVFLDRQDQDTVQIKALGLLEEFRGIGLGAYIMNFIEDIAKKNGYTRSFLTGRVYATNFYNKLGYEAIGEAYNYKKVPHVSMHKYL